MKAKYLSVILAASLFVSGAYAQKNSKKGIVVPERTISIDFNNSKGPFSTMFKECIGAGRANEGLRADWQLQLAYVKKECDFKYIRMHGLLTDDMAVHAEYYNPVRWRCRRYKSFNPWYRPGS